jgi:hypothetical protein
MMMRWGIRCFCSSFVSFVLVHAEDEGPDLLESGTALKLAAASPTMTGEERERHSRTARWSTLDPQAVHRDSQ